MCPMFPSVSCVPYCVLCSLLCPVFSVFSTVSCVLCVLYCVLCSLLCFVFPTVSCRLLFTAVSVFFCIRVEQLNASLTHCVNRVSHITLVITYITVKWVALASESDNQQQNESIVEGRLECIDRWNSIGDFSQPPVSSCLWNVTLRICIF